MFDYYASLYSGDGEDTAGVKAAEEPDIFNISFAAFMNMCEHNKLVSRKVPAGEFEVIWSIVNAKDKALSSQEDKHNKDKALNRQEFLQALVRCAVVVYVQRGAIGDVSDAVQLCVGHLLTCLQMRCPAAVQSSNAFRRRFCYLEATTLVLEAHLGSLRTLYDNYAEVSYDASDCLRDDALMSIGEWLAFVRHMGLIEARQLSVTQAKHVFLWSRIRTAEGVSDKAEARLRHLTFEDFLEALVRLATLMAFPTQVEIDAVSAKHAGEFLHGLQADAPDQYSAFLRSHKPAHTDPDGTDFDADGTGLKALFQPVWLTIKHLVHLLVHTVERNTSALRSDEKADGVVQASEASNFIKRRVSGKALTVRAGSLAGSDWRLAQDTAFVTAAAIQIQMASRARKARKKVEERRQRAAVVAQEMEQEAQLEGQE